jgi:hypothetical protein
MGDFFRDRRRTIGCAVLMLALAVMGGWIRSRRYTHTLTFQGGGGRWPSTIHTISSCHRGLLWIQKEMNDFDKISTQPRFSCFFGPADRDVFEREIYCGSIWKSYWTAYIWKWYGFRYETNDKPDPRGLIRIWVIPYWVLVIPLTWFAAYLLLTKSRRSKQAERFPPRTCE